MVFVFFVPGSRSCLPTAVASRPAAADQDTVDSLRPVLAYGTVVPGGSLAAVHLSGSTGPRGRACRATWARSAYRRFRPCSRRALGRVLLSSPLPQPAPSVVLRGHTGCPVRAAFYRAPGEGNPRSMPEAPEGIKSSRSHVAAWTPALSDRRERSSDDLDEPTSGGLVQLYRLAALRLTHPLVGAEGRQMQVDRRWMWMSCVPCSRLRTRAIFAPVEISTIS